MPPPLSLLPKPQPAPLPPSSSLHSPSLLLQALIPFFFSIPVLIAGRRLYRLTTALSVAFSVAFLVWALWVNVESGLSFSGPSGEHAALLVWCAMFVAGFLGAILGYQLVWWGAHVTGRLCLGANAGIGLAFSILLLGKDLTIRAPAAQWPFLAFCALLGIILVLYDHIIGPLTTVALQGAFLFFLGLDLLINRANDGAAIALRLLLDHNPSHSSLLTTYTPPKATVLLILFSWLVGITSFSFQFRIFRSVPFGPVPPPSPPHKKKHPEKVSQHHNWPSPSPNLSRHFQAWVSPQGERDPATVPTNPQLQTGNTPHQAYLTHLSQTTPHWLAEAVSAPGSCLSSATSLPRSPALASDRHSEPLPAQVLVASPTIGLGSPPPLALGPSIYPCYRRTPDSNTRHPTRAPIHYSHTHTPGISSFNQLRRVETVDEVTETGTSIGEGEVTARSYTVLDRRDQKEPQARVGSFNQDHLTAILTLAVGNEHALPHDAQESFLDHETTQKMNVVVEPLDHQVGRLRFSRIPLPGQNTAAATHDKRVTVLPLTNLVEKPACPKRHSSAPSRPLPQEPTPKPPPHERKIGDQVNGRLELNNFPQHMKEIASAAEDLSAPQTSSQNLPRCNPTEKVKVNSAGAVIQNGRPQSRVRGVGQQFFRLQSVAGRYLNNSPQPQKMLISKNSGLNMTTTVLLTHCSGAPKWREHGQIPQSPQSSDSGGSSLVDFFLRSAPDSSVPVSPTVSRKPMVHDLNQIMKVGEQPFKNEPVGRAPKRNSTGDSHEGSCNSAEQDHRCVSPGSSDRMTAVPHTPTMGNMLLRVGENAEQRREKSNAECGLRLENCQQSNDYPTVDSSPPGAATCPIVSQSNCSSLEAGPTHHGHVGGEGSDRLSFGSETGDESQVFCYDPREDRRVEPELEEWQHLMVIESQVDFTISGNSDNESLSPSLQSIPIPTRDDDCLVKPVAHAPSTSSSPEASGRALVSQPLNEFAWAQPQPQLPTEISEVAYPAVDTDL